MADETPGARWLTTVPGLADTALRIRYAIGELCERDLPDLAQSLDELCSRSEQYNITAREVLTAFVPAVIDPDHAARVTAIRGQAARQGLPAAGRLLRGSGSGGHLPPPRARSEEAAEQEAMATLTHGDGRPLSLGERRAHARMPNRAALDRMLRDPHPMVVRILLANPKITEDDVLRMATRRPADPKVLCEIAKRWTHRARVRLAIALNPGAPTAVSVPVLGLLAAHELRQVIRATELVGVVRATAGEIQAVRPPPKDAPSGPPPIH